MPFDENGCERNNVILKNFSKSNDVKEISFWFKYFDLNF